MNRSFTRSRAELHRESIRALTEHLLDAAGDEFDAITALAAPIPVAVIARLMGVPETDQQALLAWSHAIVRVFDLNVTVEEEAAAEVAVTEFAEYLRTLLRARANHPGDDLLSELISADDPLSEDDLVATAILILNAGHEATVHAIGNGILALARNPEAMALLHSNPDHAATSAEELLRFDPPLQMFERWVLEDLEWNGHHLATGDKVGLLFGAANHDPDVFEHPERLDITRTENPHVSFGLGTHFCLGAPLARIELEEAFGALARRTSRIDLLESEPPRTPSLVFRGVDALRISLH